jgi:hypothetical protein
MEYGPGICIASVRCLFHFCTSIFIRLPRMQTASTYPQPIKSLAAVSLVLLSMALVTSFSLIMKYSLTEKAATDSVSLPSVRTPTFSDMLSRRNTYKEYVHISMALHLPRRRMQCPRHVCCTALQRCSSILWLPLRMKPVSLFRLDCPVAPSFSSPYSDGYIHRSVSAYQAYHRWTFFEAVLQSLRGPGFQRSDEDRWMTKWVGFYRHHFL